LREIDGEAFLPVDPEIDRSLLVHIHAHAAIGESLNDALSDVAIA